jgi:hypothetical protein
MGLECSLGTLADGAEPALGARGSSGWGAVQGA